MQFAAAIAHHIHTFEWVLSGPGDPSSRIAKGPAQESEVMLRLARAATSQGSAFLRCPSVSPMLEGACACGWAACWKRVGAVAVALRFCSKRVGRYLRVPSNARVCVARLAQDMVHLLYVLRVAGCSTSASVASAAGWAVQQVRWASKKQGGSTRNKSKNNAQNLGFKMFGGHRCSPGNIILRQRGTEFHPGQNVGMVRCW